MTPKTCKSDNLFAKQKIIQRLEAMDISLMAVQLGHSTEHPLAALAWKLGVSMRRPPVVASMRGSAEFLETTLTGAGMARLLVMNEILVLPQRIHVCKFFLAALPGTPLFDSNLCPLGCLLLQPSALGDRGRPNLILEKAELDLFDLRDLNPVHHLSLPVWVKDNVDFHPGNPSRSALNLRLGGRDRP